MSRLDLSRKPLVVAAALKRAEEPGIEQLAKRSPLERLGKPEDVAELIAFLVAPPLGACRGRRRLFDLDALERRHQWIRSTTLSSIPTWM